MTKQTPHMKPTHKELQQSNHLEWSVGKGWGLKIVLLARNLTLNADTARHYKCMFGPHMGLLPHHEIMST